LILDHDGVGTAGPENKASAEEINKISGRNILCLIATLPDPIRSSSYGFDEDLTALQRGVESQGYVLDRYCFPWTEKSATPRRWTWSCGSRPPGASGSPPMIPRVRGAIRGLI
jgi:hypothetical protein